MVSTKVQSFLDLDRLTSGLRLSCSCDMIFGRESSEVVVLSCSFFVGCGAVVVGKGRMG